MPTLKDALAEGELPRSSRKTRGGGQFFSACCLAITIAGFGAIAVCGRATPPSTSAPAALAVPDTPVASVPADPHELATGPIETPSNPKQISDAFALIERARASMMIYRSGDLAFTSKVTFTSSAPDGSSAAATANPVPGEIEDTLLPSGKERWLARLGNYTILRIFDDNVAYDEKSEGPIPLRIQMLNAAIFWPFTSATAQDLIRTTSATWDGKKVICLLLSHNSELPPATGRGWNESEYCIDAKSHLLQTYSEAPGVYVVYDYHDAAQFHDRTLPKHVTIFEAGAQVIDAHLDTIEDAGTVDPRELMPSRTATAPGVLLVAPVHAQAPGILAAVTMVQPMIVHASVGDDGAVLEEEPLEGTDPARTQTALDLVKHTRFMQKIQSGKPGQRDMYIEVDFLPNAAAGHGQDLTQPGNHGNHK
jgi:hypothetical protein